MPNSKRFKRNTRKTRKTRKTQKVQKKQRGGKPEMIRIAGERAWKYEMTVGEKLVFEKTNQFGTEWKTNVVDTEFFDFRSYQKNDDITFTFTAKKPTDYTLIILAEQSITNEDDKFNVEPIVVAIFPMTPKEVKEIKAEVRPIVLETKDALKAARQEVKDNLSNIDRYVSCPSITDCMKREFLEIDAHIASALGRIKKLEQQVGDLLVPMVHEKRQEEAEDEAKFKGYESDEAYQQFLANEAGLEHHNKEDESAARIAGMSVDEYIQLRDERDKILPSLEMDVYIDARMKGMSTKPQLSALEYLEAQEKAYKLKMGVQQYLSTHGTYDLNTKKYLDSKKKKWFGLFGGNKKY